MLTCVYNADGVGHCCCNQSGIWYIESFPASVPAHTDVPVSTYSKKLEDGCEAERKKQRVSH